MSLLFCSASSSARFSVNGTAAAPALAAGACAAFCANAGALAVTSAPAHTTASQTFILDFVAAVLIIRASLGARQFRLSEVFKHGPALRRKPQAIRTAAIQSAASPPPVLPSTTP